MEEETIEEEESSEVEEEPVEEMEEEVPEEETAEEPEEEVAEEEKPKEERSFERKMYKAVCADCGKECEVPFKPIEGRKIYCRDCYRKHRPRRF